MRHAAKWSQQVFGGAQLGDARRSARLVRVAAQAAETPAGKVTEVFSQPAERQAVYDFLESTAIAPERLTEALARSSAYACASRERVLVVLDGTSLTVTDTRENKGLGRVGTFSAGATGAKVINALALTEAGTPIGIADQIWWTRQERVKKNVYRSGADRESAHWRTAVERTTETFSKCAPDTKLHYLCDREADAALLIHTVIRLGQEFTIRSNATRKVVGRRGRVGIRAVLAQRAAIATMEVAIPANSRRPARVARLLIRAAPLEVLMRDHHVKETRRVVLTYVWAREIGRRDGLDWMLVTNTKVPDAEAACESVRRYTRRWRIEDFHKTWKSGLCKVEETQLRSSGAIIKWATILGAVAIRAEELRNQARESPDEPATTILSKDEIEALVLLKTEIKRRTETVTAAGLTVVMAVRWIAELGGYVGNKRSGPPGSITIGRGLERLEFAARLIERLRATRKMR